MMNSIHLVAILYMMLISVAKCSFEPRFAPLSTPVIRQQQQMPFERSVDHASSGSTPGATDQSRSARSTPQMSVASEHVPPTRPLLKAIPLLNGIIKLYTSAQMDSKSRYQLDAELIDNQINDFVIVKDGGYLAFVNQERDPLAKSIPSAKSVKTYFDDVDIAFEKCTQFGMLIEKRNRNMIPFIQPFYFGMMQILDGLPRNVSTQIYDDWRELQKSDRYIGYLNNAYAEYVKNNNTQPAIPLFMVADVKKAILEYWKCAFPHLFMLKFSKFVDTLSETTLVCDAKREELFEFFQNQEGIIKREADNMYRSASVYYQYLNGGEVQNDLLTNTTSILMASITNLLMLKADLDIAILIKEWQQKQHSDLGMYSTVAVQTLLPRNGSVLHSLLRQMGYRQESIYCYTASENKWGAQRLPRFHYEVHGHRVMDTLY